jgi:hypothetical protein
VSTSSGALPVIGLLSNGVTKTGLAGALGSQQFFVYPRDRGAIPADRAQRQGLSTAPLRP